MKDLTLKDLQDFFDTYVIEQGPIRRLLCIPATPLAISTLVLTGAFFIITVFFWGMNPTNWVVKNILEPIMDYMYDTKF